MSWTCGDDDVGGLLKDRPGRRSGLPAGGAALLGRRAHARTCPGSPACTSRRGRRRLPACDLMASTKPTVHVVTAAGSTPLALDEARNGAGRDPGLAHPAGADDALPLMRLRCLLRGTPWPWAPSDRPDVKQSKCLVGPASPARGGMRWSGARSRKRGGQGRTRGRRGPRPAAGAVVRRDGPAGAEGRRGPAGQREALVDGALEDDLRGAQAGSARFAAAVVAHGIEPANASRSGRRTALVDRCGPGACCSEEPRRRRSRRAPRGRWPPTSSSARCTAARGRRGLPGIDYLGLLGGASSSCDCCAPRAAPAAGGGPGGLGDRARRPALDDFLPREARADVTVGARRCESLGGDDVGEIMFTWGTAVA